MRVWALLVMAACTHDMADDPVETAPLTAFDRVEAWEGQGTWSVGYREWSTTYTTATTGELRTLRLVAWYPTSETAGATVSHPGPLSARGVLREAAPADGAFPVWLFSHGHQGDVDNATHLMAHAASHGWVAVATEHTGNILADGSERQTEIYVDRPYDVRATLDALEGGVDGLPDTTDQVFGTGHSFGGYTMFLSAGAGWALSHWDPICSAGGEDDAFCSTWRPELVSLMGQGAADPRIDAFATLSGGNWAQIREEGFASVDAPLLQFSAVLDGSVDNPGNSDPIWRDLPAGEHLRVDIAHGDHQTYTDFAGVGSGVIPGTHVDALEASRGHRLLYVYLHAFATKHVLGESDGVDDLLDGSFVVDSEAALSWK